MKRSEEDLARAVVTWLAQQHFEIYQEVTIRGGPRCDIVAVQGPLLWAIECKLSLGMALLEQAVYWRGRANRVSVAAGRITQGAVPILRALELGGLAVPGDTPMEMVEAPFLRRTTDSLRKALREEQKTYAPAGNASSSYWTPFQATCRAVRDYLAMRANHGVEVTMKDLVDNIDHHYANRASAKQHLTHWIEEGKVQGVVVRREGRRVLVELGGHDEGSKQGVA